MPDSGGNGVVPRASELDDTPLIVNEVVPRDVQDVTQRQDFPERVVERLSSPPPADYPENLIKGVPDPEAMVAVGIMLNAQPVDEMVRMFGHEEVLNFSYLIDPELKGKGAITMEVDSEMTAREAWQMFEHILWLNGAYASKNPGFIHILPFAKMPRERRLLATHDPMANVAVELMPIHYVKSSEIMTHLQEFITEGASVMDISGANSLLIVEAPTNMPKLRELVDRLDTRGEAAWPHRVLLCQETDCETVLADLQAVLPVLGLPVTNQTPSGGQIKLAALPRLQVIVASAALSDVLDEVRHWHTVFDREDRGEQENIFFYNVRHSTASQLAEVIGVFFNSSATSSGPSRTESVSARSSARSGSASGSSDRDGSSGTERTARTTRATAARQKSGATTPRSLTPGEKGDVFGSPVLVYVDEVQNRLTIRTTERTYALVEALLRRQDVQPRQVMIEANIAEIRLTKDTEFGFSYAAEQKLGDYDFKHAMVHSSLLDSGVPVEPATLATGVAMSFVKDADQLAFLRAVAGEGNVRVLSAPQIMAATGQLARIDVGAKVPVKISDYTDVSGSSSRNSYDYEETGTRLEVIPYITAGNEVQLDIMQEVSSATATTTGVTDSPTILRKILETTLVVPDGGTVMMGGLIGTESSAGDTGVPGLRKLPWLGWLFRTNLASESRTEILVLITVNVVENATQTEALMQRYQAALQEIAEKLDK